MPAGFPCRVITISSVSASRKNRDKSSLTSVSATRRIGRSVLGKPVSRLGLCNDGEDFDGFDRDVIENSYLSDPKAILWLTQTPEPLDSALARPSGLLPQVPFKSVPHLSAMISWQSSISLYCVRGQHDLISHLARL
jgi:hypothetical protein